MISEFLEKRIFRRPVYTKAEMRWIMIVYPIAQVIPASLHKVAQSLLDHEKSLQRPLWVDTDKRIKVFLFLYLNITDDYERSKSERYKWFYESMIFWTNAVKTSFLNEINALRFTAPSGWEKVTLKEVMWPDS